MYLKAFFIFILVSGFACTDSKITLSVDMAAMHDRGIFNPDKGDVVAIAGSFNDWEPTQDILTDKDGDWIFELTLNKDRVNEHLEFKFVSEQEINVPNGGWEIIPNRKISVKDIRKKNHVFVFNKPWGKVNQLGKSERAHSFETAARIPEIISEIEMLEIKVYEKRAIVP